GSSCCTESGSGDAKERLRNGEEAQDGRRDNLRGLIACAHVEDDGTDHQHDHPDARRSSERPDGEAGEQPRSRTDFEHPDNLAEAGRHAEMLVHLYGDLRSEKLLHSGSEIHQSHQNGNHGRGQEHRDTSWVIGTLLFVSYYTYVTTYLMLPSILFMVTAGYDEQLTGVFALLGKRWTGLIVGVLMGGPAHFSELRRRIPGISE